MGNLPENLQNAGDNSRLAQLYNAEVEETILATALVFPEEVSRYAVEGEWFYNHRNRMVWNAIAGIINRNEIPDILTVTTELERRSHLEPVGGAARITQLVNSYVSSVTVEQAISTLRELWVRRYLVTQANWMVNQAFDRGQIVGSIQDTVIANLATITTGKYHARHISEVTNTVYEEVIARYANPQEVWGIKSGYHILDHLTGGTQPAELIYVAGRPGVGKSIFVNQWGIQAADHCKGVALFSLEMKDTRVARRLLSAEGKINTRSLATGFMSDSDWEAFTRAVDTLNRKNVYIWDVRGMTVSELRAELARLKKHGIEIAVVDYLYLIGGFDNLDPTARTETISSQLKTIAGQTDISIIAVNSVVKEGMKGFEPQLTDMRGSGQLQHDADVILFPYEFSPKTPEDHERAAAAKNTGYSLRKIKVLKLRDGEYGENQSFTMGFTQGYPSFLNLTSQDNNAPIDEEQVELWQPI